MRKLWIVSVIFVTASMTSAAYGGSVNVAPVITIGAPSTQITSTVSGPHNTVVNQLNSAVNNVIQTPTSIAYKGNANATASSVITNTLLNKSTIIRFGQSSAIGQ